MTPGILSLATIPTSAFAAGLGTLCVSVLYALHHLRADPPRREIATLLFWQLAVRATQNQVPWSRRFTHRRTFLLLASILLLLAASLVADRWNTGASRDMIVIDAGEETAAPTSGGQTLLDTLANAAATDLTRLNANAGLVVAGSLPAMQIPPGQPSVVTLQALRRLLPQSGASASSLALQEAGLAIGDRAGRIFWYTPTAAVPEDILTEIRQRIVLRQVSAPPQLVISGVTFVPSSRGDASGDLRVQLAGSAVSGITLRAEGQEGPSIQAPIKKSSKTDEVIFNDWPANGKPVSLSLLSGSGGPVAHEVRFRVPDHRPLVFKFAGTVPAALKLALLSVGVEATDAGNPKVIFVAEEGTATPPEAVASIRIDSRQGTGVKAGLPLRLGELPLVKGLTLEGAVASEGPALNQTGSAVLTTGSTILADLDLSRHLPTLTLSASVVSPTADLPRHAAFPILIKRLCDALTGRSNEPVALCQSRWASDPLWTGPPQLPAVDPQAVFDPPSPPAAHVALPAVQSERWSPRWSDIILAGAFMLLTVESLLYAARRIV